ncbi:MAG: hypothetical protein WC522_05055 [Candidatus Omnitrophota bacterium]
MNKKNLIAGIVLFCVIGSLIFIRKALLSKKESVIYIDDIYF